MRYMDDFVILARSRLELVEQLEKITEFLHTELRLELNPKTKIYKPMHGIDFVGYRHFHDYRLIRKDSCTGGQRRALSDVEFEYAIGIFQTTNPEMEVKNNATFQR